MTTQCHACGGELMDMRGKMICTRCFTINETCCDGGKCYTSAVKDVERSSTYKEVDDTLF